jgi:hypothetical protein
VNTCNIKVSYGLDVIPLLRKNLPCVPQREGSPDPHAPSMRDAHVLPNIHPVEELPSFLMLAVVLHLPRERDRTSFLHRPGFFRGDQW